MRRYIFIALLIFAAGICTTALAQRGGRDVSEALTGTNPVAPVTTGLGQVISPTIPSPLLQKEEDKKESPLPQGLTVPYPVGGRPIEAQPERTGGNYYGPDVKQSGQYYEGGAREKGGYMPLGIPEKPTPTETKPTETKPSTPVPAESSPGGAKSR